MSSVFQRAGSMALIEQDVWGRLGPRFPDGRGINVPAAADGFRGRPCGVDGRPERPAGGTGRSGRLRRVGGHRPPVGGWHRHATVGGLVRIRPTAEPRRRDSNHE